MIDASTVRAIQEKWAYELHLKLCIKIEQAVLKAATDNRTELLVQLPNAMQLATHAHPASIRLEAHAYDIARLQFCLKDNGYEIDNSTYSDSFIIKW